MMIARAFRDLLGFNEIYIADLNSIQGSRLSSHRKLISTLARDEKFDITLDAGISDHKTASEWLSLGVRKAVIGTETLEEFNTIKNLPSQIDRNRLSFSLDIRAGKTVSQCPELADVSPIEVLCHLQASCWTEAIILDLSRVGSEEGIDGSFVKEARARFPDINLLVGGGIANPEQLIELKRSGIAGALVATILHRGILTARHISAIEGLTT